MKTTVIKKNSKLIKKANQNASTGVSISVAVGHTRGVKQRIFISNVVHLILFIGDGI